MDNGKVWDLIAKKLSGEASPEELLELEKALRMDPDLHYSLEAVHDLWVSNPTPQAELAEKAYEKHLERLQSAGVDFSHGQPGPSRSIFKLYSKKFRAAGMAALFLLAFAGIYRMTRPRLSPPQKAEIKAKNPGEIVTQNGTRTKLLLPDGTLVWLNAGSHLIYDSTYDNVNREVSLSGEAFFDVKKNKEKPFLIHAGNINITVLGTSLNVKSYPGDKTIETSLILGKIEVSFKDHVQEKVILRPNQKLIVPSETAAVDATVRSYNKKIPKSAMIVNSLSRFGPDSLIAETAWVENKLVFQDESFAELARKMERWYGISIVLDDKTLDTLHFTGSFEKENIRQALTALHIGSNFNFTIHNSEAHIQKTY